MTIPVLASPSSRFSPICGIHEHSLEMLASLIDYLRAIYNPPVRGTRRVDRKAIKSTPYLNGGENGKEALEALHVDELERAYAVRWLTGLVSRASLLPSLL